MVSEGPFEAVRLRGRVYWVGAVDWGIRDFHGYTTRRGSTYNAYLILDGEDAILVDTVKAKFKDEMLSRVASVVDPGKIRYIISNHSEMDHSGSLVPVIEEVKPEKVFASEMGVKNLESHFRGLGDVLAVKDQEKLTLGNIGVLFVETRMLHWPDSMMTFLPSEKLLFSQDGFGMHLATGERFADEIPMSVLEEEGSRYYANILMPYSALVEKLLKKVSGMGLEIEIIAPDHGPIWRRDLEVVLGYYSKWAAQEPSNKVVIAFDTMWGSTETMARAIAEGVVNGGGGVTLMPLKSSHRSDVATEVLDAGALLVGTPTINNGMFPTVADLLAYLGGLKPRNLAGAAFGSYGWSGEGARVAGDLLGGMNVHLLRDSLSCRFVPDPGVLEECRSLGVSVARRLEGE